MAEKWATRMNGHNGRDINGRFKRGYGGGPGRPCRQTEQTYLHVLIETVPPDQWRKVCEKALAQALEGDAKAREWLANYLIGRPTQAVEVNETRDSPLSLDAILEVIREAVPDGAVQAKIGEGFRR